MSASEVHCVCGAVNDVTFGSCIRCSRPLRPEPARPVKRFSAGSSALWLGALCTAVFAIELALERRAGGGVPILGGSGIVLFRTGMLSTHSDVLGLEPFRFLSAVYVHFGILHFGLNMLGLYNQAKVADTAVGAARTVIAFIVGGVVGFLTTFAIQLLTDGAPTNTAGASGGLLAVMGLSLGVMARRRLPGFWGQAGNVLFYVVLFGFAFNASKSSVQINNSAHIGGLVCGFLFGYIWGKTGSTAGAATRIAAIGLFILSVASVLLALNSDLYKLAS